MGDFCAFYRQVLEKGALTSLTFTSGSVKILVRYINFLRQYKVHICLSRNILLCSSDTKSVVNQHGFLYIYTWFVFVYREIFYYAFSDTKTVVNMHVFYLFIFCIFIPATMLLDSI